MRKSLLLLLVLLLTAFCACAAAETEYPLEAVSGRMSFDENTFIVLTPGTLSEHPDLLQSLGKTADELRADMEARGVLFQAWSKDQKTCVEVILIQDELSAKYFDTEAQTRADRKQYMTDVISEAKQSGYAVFDPVIKNHGKSGNYVEFEYLFKGDGTEHRGYIRKIVRNGYTLSVDYQAYQRKPRKSDEDRIRHIINTVVIEQAAAIAPAATASGEGTPESASDPAVPAGAANTLSVTVLPPEKTNTGVFTVEGTAYPGSEIIVVAMRWSGSAYRFPAIAGNNGKFSSKVTLPDEGLYQVTVNMCINNATVADAVLNPVTFNKSVLPYSLDAEIPETLTSDELVISGTTEKNVEIQCLVNRGSVNIPIKSVKTNGTGKFKFKVPTAVEGEYDITLVFSKKNLSTERMTRKATRTFTEADNKANVSKDAKKVNYNTLVKKIDTYFGQTLVFDVYITDVKQVGDQWMITAAQKLNRKKYSNYLIYMADEDPGLVTESRVRIYGTCTGPYEIQSEDGNVSYPGFDYLFFE